MAYQCGMEPACFRQSNILILPGLPDDITEDDLFMEFTQFGNILSIKRDLNNSACLEFSLAREAATAERYVLRPFISSPGMGSSMPDPMMRHYGGAMGGPYGAPMPGAMGGPMGGAMVAQMQDMMGVPMMNGPMMNPPFAWQPPVPSMKSPVAPMRISTKGDGSREIFSPPGNFNIRSPQSQDDGFVDPTLVCGPCTKCSKRTSYTCGRCGAYYCSPDCQKQDWSVHQSTCNNSIPPLNYAGKSGEVMPSNGQPYQTSSYAPPPNQRSYHGRSSSGPRQSFNNLNSPPNRSYQRQGSQENEIPVKSEQMNGRMQPSSSGQQSGQQRSHGQRPAADQIRNSSVAGDDRRFSRQSSAKEGFGTRNRTTTKGGEFSGSRRGNDDNFEPKKLLTKPPASSETDIVSPQTEVAVASKNEVHTVKETVKSSPKAGEKETTEMCNGISGIKISSPNVVKEAVSSSSSALLPDPVFTSEPSNKPTSVSAVPPVNDLPSPAGKTNSGPPARQEKPPTVNIPSGGLVTICFRNGNLIYLRPADATNKNLSLSMENKLALHCASAPSLNRQPKKKEFVAVQYSLDQVYYRAIVESRPVKSEHKYKVYFVDYGNEDSGLTSDKMIAMPDDIAMVPCMCVETFLAGLQKVPFSEEAINVLNMCLALEAVLTVEYSGDDISKGVVLKDEHGQSLNSKVLNALTSAPVVAPTPVVAAPVEVAPTPAVAPTPVVAPTPAVVPAPAVAPTPAVVPAPAVAPIPVVSPPPAVAAGPEPAPEPPRRFTIDDISSFDLPPVGTESDVVIQHVYEEAGILMVSPLDEEVFNKITNMNTALEAYARNAKPFRPNANELCVAKWTDEEWYRGVCLTADGDSFSIMFLEYGNTDSVAHTNIVPFTEELIRVPALSSVCFLSGPELTEAQKKKLKSLYRDEWMVKATVIEKTQDSCIISCPTIQEQL